MRPFPDPRFPPSPYYRFLRLLAASVRPRLSVELGLCGGGGSLHLALGWPVGHVIGVEVSEGDPEKQENWAYIEKRCPKFVRWRGDSISSALEIFERYGPADILFLDTVHTYEQTLKEWRAWEPLLSKQAFACFDDLRRPGMQEAWDEIPWPHKLRLDTLHDGAEFGGGFGIVWR